MTASSITSGPNPERAQRAGRLGGVVAIVAAQEFQWVFRTR
jgi:hypothetical protein